jgi:uncharacterized protein (DUF1501 family)
MPRHHNLTSRRELLKVGLGALPVITIGGSVPFLVPKLAFAQDTPGTPIPKDNILVIVQLSGGNDGLNTVVPFKHDTYKKIRPRIALSERLHALNDEFALNPGMTAFKTMFDEGNLAVIHGCGYPQPNRSHFESMAIWHAAQTDGGGGSGWLGHYLDHLSRGTQGKDIANNPLLGVNIGREVPQALVSPEITVPSVDSIDDFGLRFDEGSAYDKELERQIIVELNKYKGENPAMEYLGRQATDAIISADEIRNVAGKYSPDANYPGGLGQRLRLIAQLICGDFGTRVFYCEMGGYDTHANQVQQHEALLNQVAESISAFYVDLGKKNIADKVTVMCFSEFGRRVEQNANDGTDHGAAGPMFVCGPKVQGGVYGTHPSLDTLEQGDLAFTTDFRTVYAAMLTHWLNADADAVLKAHFDPLPLIKGVQPVAPPATQPTTQPAGPAAPPAGGDMMQGGGMQGAMTGPPAGEGKPK